MWQFADEYVDAGDKLKPQLNTPGRFPLYLLYCHGIELGVKAFLISQGITDGALRDLGHDLTRALRAARKHASFVSPSKTDLRLICWVNPYYKGKEFEYLFPGAKSLPQPDTLGRVAHRLLTRLKPIIRKAVKTHLAQVKAAACGTALDERSSIWSVRPSYWVHGRSLS